jgi:hypothetical protein
MDALWLEIRLLFPQDSSSEVLENFATYLPSFSQTFGNLTKDAAFKNIIIEGSGRDIICDVSVLYFFMKNKKNNLVVVNESIHHICKELLWYHSWRLSRLRLAKLGQYQGVCFFSAPKFF